MSKVFKAVGTVLGIAAAIAAIPVTGGASIAPYLAAAAVAANIGATVTAKRPPRHTGSVADILIGADQATPMMLGNTYAGGVMVHQAGYGPTVNDVPNTYLFMATVYSVGPIESIDSYYADFTEVAWGSPVSGVREATGYFNDILFEGHQLGARPESAALPTPSGWGTPPDWGTTYKLSGKAAVSWSLKWDSKNGKYASGAPQLGIQGNGVLRYDPRLDDTYDGGEGDHRWADPKTAKTDYDAATATWEGTRCPGLHALNYALGTWERDTADTDSVYKLSFGIGLPFDGIVVEDFVELANVCDANGWNCDGVIWEPGDKWANLKRILEAGGAEPCFKGGRLGLKLNAPRVSLDTITRDDIAEGDVSIAGAQPWRDRINTAIPKCISPAHKWTLQQSTTTLTVSDWVTEDGEVKRQEIAFDLVKDFDQAAQLAAYRMYNGREQGPITMTLPARFRNYAGGDVLTLDDDLVAEFGLAEADCVVISRNIDPATMRWTFTMMTETAAKHTAALAATGAAPDAITIPTSEELDGVVNGSRLAGFKATEAVATDSTGGAASVAFTAPVTAGWTYLEIWVSGTDDFGTATSEAGPIYAGLGEPSVESVTGLTPGLTYFWIVTFDAGGQITRTASFSATIT